MYVSKSPGLSPTSNPDSDLVRPWVQPNPKPDSDLVRLRDRLSASGRSVEVSQIEQVDCTIVMGN